MRPTQTQVQQFGVAQDAQIPQVGLQVTSAPVQLTPDDSKLRQLETLKGQLDAFTSGQMANAKLQDQLQQQRDQQQAELDFAKDPSKFDAQAGSGYYYLHGMDLMGEAEAVKMGARLKTSMNALLSDPEKLRGTDINQFFQDSIQQEMAGVSDPIVAKHLNKEVNKVSQKELPLLIQAQREAEQKYRRDTSHFIFSQRADTPDNTRAYLQSDFPTLVSRLGKEDAAAVVAGVLSTKIAEARTSDEAAGWLAMFGTKIPGLQGPDGKAAAFSTLGGEKLGGQLSKVRQAVQSMKDAEARAAESARREAEKEAARVRKEQQSMHYADAKALLDVAHDEASLADAVQLFNSMDLDDTHRQSLGIQVRASLGKLAQLEAANLENPEALTQRVSRAVQEGGAGAGIQVAMANIQRLRAGSNPAVLRGLIKGLFEDASAMRLEPGQDGAYRLTAQNEALIGLYSTLSTDPDLVAFMPEKDQRFFRVLENKKAEHGGNLGLALRDAKAAMSRPHKPIPWVSTQDAVEVFLDKTVSQKLMGDYDDVTLASQQALRTWAYEATKDLSELDYPTPGDLSKALSSKYQNEFVVMTSGGGPFRNTDVLYVGPEGKSKGYTVVDDQGKTVNKVFREVELVAAYKQLKDYLGAKGYSDIALKPTDHFTGDHMLTYTINGQQVAKPFHVTQLAEVAYKLAEEKTAGLEVMRPVNHKGATAAMGLTGLMEDKSKPQPVAQKTHTGAVERFMNQLDVGMRRQDLTTSLQSVPNDVTGQGKAKVQDQLYQLQAAETRARLKKQ